MLKANFSSPEIHRDKWTGAVACRYDTGLCKGSPRSDLALNKDGDVMQVYISLCSEPSNLCKNK